MIGRQRPVEVSTVAALCAIEAIILLVLGVFLILLGLAVVTVESVVPHHHIAWSLGVGLVSVAIGGIMLVGAGVDFVISYGLLKGRKWGWALALIFAIWAFFAGIFALPIGLVQMVIGGIIFCYLLHPHVRKFFFA